MSNVDEVFEYGIVYPDGTVQWTANSFDDVGTDVGRLDFSERYNKRLKSLGVDPLPLKFLRRTITTVIGDPNEVTS